MHATIRITGLSLAALLAVSFVAAPAHADEPVEMKPYSSVQIILDDPDPVGRLLIRDRKTDDPRTGGQAGNNGGPADEGVALPPPLLGWVRLAVCARPDAPVALCSADWRLERPRRRR